MPFFLQAICRAVIVVVPPAFGVDWSLASKTLVRQPAVKATDRYGDPLPEGAIVRLGSLRLTHLGGLAAVCVSPDGRIAASGVRCGKHVSLGQRYVPEAGARFDRRDLPVTLASIRLWNTHTGELIRQIGTPDAPVSSICFASDGRTFFAGCGRFVCCWETGTGKKLWQREALREGRSSMWPGADRVVLGNEVLASLHSGTLHWVVERDLDISFHRHPQRFLRLWNVKTGAPLPLPAPLESTVTPYSRVTTLFHDLAVSPGVGRAAVLTSEVDQLPRDDAKNQWTYHSRRLEVIDVAGGQVLHRLADPDGTLAHPAFAADGRALVLANGKQKEIWLIDLESSQKRVLARDVSVSHLAFVGNKQVVGVSNDASRQVLLWNVDTGERIDGKLSGEELWGARAGSVAATPHGNTIRLVDAGSGEPLHAFAGHRLPPSLRYSLNSPDTLISRDAEVAFLWDSRSWKVRKTLTMPAEFSAHRWQFDYDTCLDRGVSVETGLYVRRSDRNGELRDFGTEKVVRHLEGAAAIGPFCNFSATGNRLVRRDGGWHDFYDTSTGKLLARTPGDPDSVRVRWDRTTELSSRGRYFARPSENNDAIELFDVDSGEMKCRLAPAYAADTGASGGVLKFHFSADERLLYGEVQQVLDDQGYEVEKVSVTIWRVDTGAILQELILVSRTGTFRPKTERSIDSRIRVLAISNDHRLVALTREMHSESGDPIEIWEVASGDKRGELRSDGRVADLAFSPDGRQLASAGDDSTILIWDMNRPLQPVKPATRLSERELAGCWRTLSKKNARKADAAIWKMVHAGADSIAFLKGKLVPAAGPDAGRVRELLADLDADEFRARRRAEAELAAQGGLLLAQLEEEAGRPNSLEKSTRLHALIAKARLAAAQPFRSREVMRQCRALEVLERIGTPEATRFVRELSHGAPGAWLTTAAEATLGRLDARTNQRN